MLGFGQSKWLSKMFIIFGKMLETVTRDDAHFSMSFWIFELIYIVFELEQIYVIYIFNASIILIFCEGL